MKQNAAFGSLFKNIMIVMEVLLCVTALLLLVFRHSVAGFETEVPKETLVMEGTEEPAVESAEEYLQEDEPLAGSDTEADIEAETDTDAVTETETETDTDIRTSQETLQEQSLEEQEELRRMKKAEEMKADWRLFLTNKNHYIPTDYEPELVAFTGRHRVDERITEDLQEMIDAAKEDGVRLQIVSAYRDFDRQKRLYEKKVRAYRRKGMTFEEASMEAAKTVAVPGTSEHQLGLALDIVGSSNSALTESFADTKAGIWLASHSYEYGFILRYPKGKEEITGIIFEPWHFRYVGKDYAKEITEQGLTLEEYLKENGVN